MLNLVIYLFLKVIKKQERYQHHLKINELEYRPMNIVK